MTARWLVGLLTVLAAAPVGAQDKGDGRLEKAVFDPQLVLQRAKEIGLTTQQRTQILDVIKKVQSDLMPFQLDMAEPAIELVDLLEMPRVDEAAVLAKTDQVLKLENEVKKRQMIMLIRIKNILTQEQQIRLRELRDGREEE